MEVNSFFRVEVKIAPEGASELSLTLCPERLPDVDRIGLGMMSFA